MFCGKRYSLLCDYIFFVVERDLLNMPDVVSVLPASRTGDPSNLVRVDLPTQSSPATTTTASTGPIQAFSLQTELDDIGMRCKYRPESETICLAQARIANEDEKINAYVEVRGNTNSMRNFYFTYNITALRSHLASQIQTGPLNDIFAKHNRSRSV